MNWVTSLPTLPSPAFSVPGWGWALVHGLFTARRVTLQLPLCDEHERAARQRSGWLPLGTRLLAIGAVAAAACAVSAIPHLAPAGAGDRGLFLFLLFASSIACAVGALLLRARLDDGFIYPLTVTEEEVELSGVAEAFARAAWGAADTLATPRDEPTCLLPGPTPRRVRRLKGLATFGLLVSIGLVLATGLVPVAAFEGPPPAGNSSAA
ncbi:MAG TPA: hypothetical protein VFE78_04080 [Gemmataceae bacterium]|nr:hypothetical protein [Gemmataceae bacterium]